MIEQNEHWRVARLVDGVVDGTWEYLAECQTDSHAWWTAQQEIRKCGFKKYDNTRLYVIVPLNFDFFGVKYAVSYDERPCKKDWT